MEFDATRSVRIRHVIDILSNIPFKFEVGDVPFLFINNSAETHLTFSVDNGPLERNQPARSATTQTIRK